MRRSSITLPACPTLARTSNSWSANWAPGLVGEPAAYAMAVRNSESKQRCTHLREKIMAAAS